MSPVTIAVTAIDPVDYTITYPDGMAITLTSTDVVLSISGTASGSVSVSQAGRLKRTVTISSISGDGTIGISLLAGTASDAAGNAALAAGPSAIFTVDIQLDSDGDSLSDGDEVNVYFTNPNISDTDNDGLTDGDEVNTYSTDPNLADTDGDGYSDGNEVSQGTNPNDPTDFPAVGGGGGCTLMASGPNALAFLLGSLLLAALFRRRAVGRRGHGQWQLHGDG